VFRFGEAQNEACRLYCGKLTFPNKYAVPRRELLLRLRSIIGYSSGKGDVSAIAAATPITLGLPGLRQAMREL